MVRDTLKAYEETVSDRVWERYWIKMIKSRICRKTHLATASALMLHFSWAFDCLIWKSLLHFKDYLSVLKSKMLFKFNMIPKKNWSFPSIMFFNTPCKMQLHHMCALSNFLHLNLFFKSFRETAYRDQYLRSGFLAEY